MMKITPDAPTIGDEYIKSLTRKEKYQLAHILLDDAIDKLNASYERALRETA